MVAEIIDGTRIAEEMRAEMRVKIADLNVLGVTPGLATVLVGSDPASSSYVGMKGRACTEMGIFSIGERLPEEATEEAVLKVVERLNADPKIHGILVQLPLPDHIEESRIIYAIAPEKDVDGLHPVNVGRMISGEPGFLPCTPRGIQELLIRSGHSPEGKHVVIVGRSSLVGKPLANILIQKKKGANATVTVCHTGTRDLAKHTRAADIIVAAAGSRNMITADMVSEGAVVIDVGTNRVDDPKTKKGYRLVGDVDFEAVKQKAGAISPVPGGVGPMTIAMLLANTIEAASMAVL